MSLVSLDATKDFLGITTTVSDVILQTYIDIVEAEVDSYTDRSLSLTTYSEVIAYKESRLDSSSYRPYNMNEPVRAMYLDQYPVTELTSITYDGTVVTASEYKLITASGVIEFYTAQQDEERNLVANYVAGYTTVSAPNDLKGVVYMGVKAMYENGGTSKQGSGNVKSKQLKDFSVSYGNEQTSLFTKTDKGLVKTYLAANDIILNKYSKVLI